MRLLLTADWHLLSWPLSGADGESASIPGARE